MRPIASLLVLGIMFFAAWASGAPSTRPADSPGLFGSSSPPPVEDLDVAARSSVADVLHRLQERDPDFQYVAQPGPWQNAAVPPMRLRAVTLSQILQMLTNVVPDLQVSDLSEGRGPNPLYVFGPRHRPAPAPGTELGAFGLADAVERIGLKNAWSEVAKDQEAPSSEQIAAGRKKGLKEVLSLLESAATQADPSSQPTLKLHEETEVLLVKGTPPQLAAVSQSLNALNSSTAVNAYHSNYSHLADQYHMSKGYVSNLKAEVDRDSQMNKSLADRLSQLQTENARLKQQLQLQGTPAIPGAAEKH